MRGGTSATVNGLGSFGDPQDMSGWPSEETTPLSPRLATAVVLATTLLLMAGVGLLVFDHSPDEGAPPEVNWNVTVEERPILHHRGGDPVRCDLVSVGGDAGSDETLCHYFDGQTVGPGDSAALDDVSPTGGSITLVWYDVETGRSVPIAELDIPSG